MELLAWAAVCFTLIYGTSWMQVSFEGPEVEAVYYAASSISMVIIRMFDGDVANTIWYWWAWTSNE